MLWQPWWIPPPPGGKVAGGLVRVEKASSDREGCYVVCGANDAGGRPLLLPAEGGGGAVPSPDPRGGHYALVDGNRVPQDMPCGAEALVRGDSREYCIGAASVLAKVTRDRLMRGYHDLWPHYNLARHKGYPTREHMAAVFRHGASPIHRRTFAPLKHMTFDGDGRILEDEDEEEE